MSRHRRWNWHWQDSTHFSAYAGDGGSVRMRLAGAAQSARTRLAGADRVRGVCGNTGRENRQFLLQLRRAAVRTFSSLPVGGPREDFAVLVAFVTMKFVDRHGSKVAGRRKISSRTCLLEPNFTSGNRNGSPVQLAPASRSVHRASNRPVERIFPQPPAGLIETIVRPPLVPLHWSDKPAKADNASRARPVGQNSGSGPANTTLGPQPADGNVPEDAGREDRAREWRLAARGAW